MAEAVAKEATKIEENYPAERLEILVKQGGVEGDDEKTIT